MLHDPQPAASSAQKALECLGGLATRQARCAVAPLRSRQRAVPAIDGRKSPKAAGFHPSKKSPNAASGRTQSHLTQKLPAWARKVIKRAVRKNQRLQLLRPLRR